MLFSNEINACLINQKYQIDLKLIFYNLKHLSIMSNNGNNQGSNFLTFILAAAAGVAAGILLAPASGRESRRKLEDQANQLKDQWGNKITDFAKTAGDQVDKFASKATEFAKKAGDQAGSTPSSTPTPGGEQI
jgi:gas vesicle protein